MNFDKFLEKILSLDIRVDEEGDRWSGSRWDIYRTKIKDGRLIIQVCWETGGVAGGSCWESSNPESYTTNNPPAELDSLKKIIREIAPDLKAIEYFDSIEPLIQMKSFDEREWYGNYTSYQAKYVYLDELYQRLVELNYIKGAAQRDN